jgi:hypothetical protein
VATAAREDPVPVLVGRAINACNGTNTVEMDSMKLRISPLIGIASVRAILL